MNEIDESPETTKVIVFATMDCLLPCEDGSLEMNTYCQYAVLCGRIIKLKEGKQFTELRFESKPMILEQITSTVWQEFRDKITKDAQDHPELFVFNKTTKRNIE